MSFPFLCAPVTDPEDGDLLVDGGAVDNAPGITLKQTWPDVKKQVVVDVGVSVS